MMIPPSPLRDDLRAEWLLDEGITFLNHGSFGAVPRIVFEAQTEWRRRIEADPIELLGRHAQELVDEAKRPIGEWLGMRGEDFGFVTNASEAVNAVLHSIDLKEGDELLTTSHVYNAVRLAMRLRVERRGGSYREIAVPLPVSSAEQIAAIVLDAIGPRTRLLVIDHVTSPTAIVFPVEAIVAGCNARGVEVLVDGAHAPGMLPLEVPKIGAAYYTGNLHKWPCAPKGCAFLWVRPDRREGVHPLVVSHHFGEGLAREFGWQGTRDLSAWLTAPRALEFMAELGWEAVRTHNHAMAVWVQQRWAIDRINGDGASPAAAGSIGRIGSDGASAADAR
jgi:isopenicillin-N epimerase